MCVCVRACVRVCVCAHKTERRVEGGRKGERRGREGWRERAGVRKQTVAKPRVKQRVGRGGKCEGQWQRQKKRHAGSKSPRSPPCLRVKCLFILN